MSEVSVSGSWFLYIPICWRCRAVASVRPQCYTEAMSHAPSPRNESKDDEASWAKVCYAFKIDSRVAYYL